MRVLVPGLILALSILATAASGAPCGGQYEVRRGDSLSLISDRLYKDARRWFDIYERNAPQIGDDPDKILVGALLALGCIDGRPTGLPQSGTPPLADAEAPELPGPEPLRLLAGSDFAPFSDPSLPRGGMMVDVVTAALADGGQGAGPTLAWGGSGLPSSDVDADIAFPVPGPACAADGPALACDGLLYSEPMFEYLVVLFVDRTRPMPFAQDRDLEGRILCQPAGLPGDQLSPALSAMADDGVLTILRDGLAACFERLATGEVDAVAANEFPARAALQDLQLTGRIAPVPNRPLGIGTLHAAVPRDHPGAAAILARINGGIRALRRSGQYRDILDRHLTQAWASL